MTDHDGSHCGWAYCPKWGTLVVEHTDEGNHTERMWVCLTHVVHAEVGGWHVIRTDRQP